MKCVCPANTTDQNLYYWPHHLPIPLTGQARLPHVSPLSSQPNPWQRPTKRPAESLPRIIAAGPWLTSEDHSGPCFPFISSCCQQSYSHNCLNSAHLHPEMPEAAHHSVLIHHSVASSSSLLCPQRLGDLFPQPDPRPPSANHRNTLLRGIQFPGLCLSFLSAQPYSSQASFRETGELPWTPRAYFIA